MKAVLLVLLLVIALPVIIPMFDPWGRINCEEQEIDLISARKRTTRFLYWVPVAHRIEDTRLSRELAIARRVKSWTKQNWRRVNTFGLYVRHSPHNAHHGAFSQIRKLEMIWDQFELEPAARQATAEELILFLRTGNSDSSIDKYLERLAAELEVTDSYPTDLSPLIK